MHPSSSPPFLSILLFLPLFFRSSKSYLTCLWLLQQRHTSLTQYSMITVSCFLNFANYHITSASFLSFFFFNEWWCQYFPMPFVYSYGPHCYPNWVVQSENHIKPFPSALSFLPFHYNLCKQVHLLSWLILQYDSVRDKWLLREQWSYLLFKSWWNQFMRT